MNNNNNNKYYIFQSLINNVYLRRRIFSAVTVIHRRKNAYNVKRWKQLGLRDLLCYGYLDEFKQRYTQQGQKFTEDELEDGIPIAPAMRGHLHCLKYLLENHASLFTGEELEGTCFSGNLQTVKYLMDNAPGQSTALSLTVAATAGALDVVKYLHNNVTNLNTRGALDAAAHRGHLNVVKYLHDNNIADGATHVAMDQAASGGFLEIVEFLHMNRSEGATTAALDGAASGGHLAVIDFLLTHRQEGGSRALEMAVRQCTPTREDYAHRRAVLDRLLAGGFASPANIALIDIAATSNDAELVRLLHERGERATREALNKACRWRNMEMIRFLVENRSEGCSIQTLNESAKVGDVELIQYLHSRLPSDIRFFITPNSDLQDQSLYLAATRNHMPVVEFLWTYRRHECSAQLSKTLEYCQTKNNPIYLYLTNQQYQQQQQQ
ncbi:hypothetical protein SAMD00019534_049880, partial [Acytostelium subglobosum LB1]|uniref:hypothetical protein n=1 Tax=Acytostelium subglobosum LB1 TaxID=1410327 RepID=UPI000644940E